MILVTGPTGSGKTTTLYTILRSRNTPDVKILTLEDPIEYKIEGINQSQIDRTREYTFATGLRSMLRQDPDILMVGEIRDLETAEVAINAALTGHMLISTLHTNDAAGALPRLLSMGVKPFLLAPALNAIISQRLVRRVCKACAKPLDLSAEDLAYAQEALKGVPPNSGENVPDASAWKPMKGKGCEVCNHTGYKGRIGLFEILFMEDPIEKALSETLSEQRVRELAHDQGMITIRQDGVLKALDGVTTVDEVRRVAG
jgi:type II secretory ATPase GspE/PulE/Tfp pilus assembly ATPase PilB-like protein